MKPSPVELSGAQLVKHFPGLRAIDTNLDSRSVHGSFVVPMDGTS